MTQEVYDEILELKNDLEKWLKNPPKTTKKFILSDTVNFLFHDKYFDVYWENNNLILDDYDNLIKFNNYKLMFEDDNKNELGEFEGYTYSSIIREDEDKKELYLEVFRKKLAI